MSKIEKIVICVLFAVLVSGSVTGFYLFKTLKDAGGISQVMIDAGREVKHIVNEVNKP